MNSVYTRTFRVNEDPQNYIRHVNNLRYLEWFIESAIAHSEALGWGMQVCKKMNLAWVAKSHSIDYLSPAYQGDELTLTTWIEKISPVRITRSYECKRGEQLLCKAQSVWVLVDYEGEKARAIPKALKNKVMQLLKQQDET